MAEQKSVSSYSQSTNLADILERVLDKGIVVAGDINVNIAEIELISIKIRLIICSVDKAKELGINWWKSDPYLSVNEGQNLQLAKENKMLLERIEKLENPTKAKK